MKFLNTMLLLVMVMALAIAISATSTDHRIHDENNNATETFSVSDSSENDTKKPVTSLRGTNRVYQFRYQMTCNKFPRVCSTRGSPGPDCCKKKCVNVMQDRANCGMCGKQCKYWEICCKGKCVNPSTNWKHCGACFNSCDKGSSCAYGMCSYA
ncbi:OLC1v1020736C1 [Oldenlandia corymbosa var. corymbosa]|uniref:OLC1v1020736C1 n=1 Tax=Oldenlandia corymbosa var. corymbosa TaxID=529605 RepID=A0AAV1BWD3_OLDCO|nr:OLC1v1020736C1 [Oldenlandia corymbosa var. corymbosa]